MLLFLRYFVDQNWQKKNSCSFSSSRTRFAWVKKEWWDPKFYFAHSQHALYDNNILKSSWTQYLGFSDSYCSLKLDSQSFRTRVMKDCLFPEWNETFQLYVAVNNLSSKYSLNVKFLIWFQLTSQKLISVQLTNTIFFIQQHRLKCRRNPAGGISWSR